MTCSREKEWNSYLVFILLTWCTLNFMTGKNILVLLVMGPIKLVGPRPLPDPPALYGRHCCESKDTSFRRYRGHTVRYFALQT